MKRFAPAILAAVSLLLLAMQETQPSLEGLARRLESVETRTAQLQSDLHRRLAEFADAVGVRSANPAVNAQRMETWIKDTDQSLRELKAELSRLHSGVNALERRLAKLEQKR